MNAIEIKGLTRRFKNRVAVDGLDLSVREGECFALLGQNGAGKTTTIKMLSGLLLPDAGDAYLMGKSIVNETNEVKKVINVSPQETAVAPLLSVRENLEFIAGVYGMDKKHAALYARQMMEKFSLTDRAKDRAKTLSGGMQRRLSIAMALISEPKVLFLDEPTLGLDVRARRDLWKVIEGLKGQITIVLTTHYLEEAEALCDRIAVMHGGKLQALGSAEELKTLTGTASFEEAFLALTEGEVD
ncbi:MAG: ABC transporter ATP-binding protein [Clostridia bacterium]|nr:ABC transporter ATP-binding protein [Clostridia bacterium]